MEPRSKAKGIQVELLPEVRRGRIERLSIYDVSEDELEILARGSSDSIYLNFAISLLSVFFSFLIALLTTTSRSTTVQVFLISATIITGINGSLLLAIWFRNRRTVSDLIEKIKARMPPEGSPTQPAASRTADAPVTREPPTP